MIGWSMRKISHNSVRKVLIVGSSGAAGPGPSDKERQILGEQDALVEDDHAPGDLPRAIHPPQHILTLADEHVGFRLDAIAVDEKATADSHFGRRRIPVRRRTQDLDV